MLWVSMQNSCPLWVSECQDRGVHHLLLVARSLLLVARSLLPALSPAPLSMLVVAVLLALAVFLFLWLCQIRVPAPGSEQRQAFFRIWSALGLLCAKVNSCQFR